MSVSVLSTFCILLTISNNCSGFKLLTDAEVPIFLESISFYGSTGSWNMLNLLNMLNMLNMLNRLIEEQIVR
jgi:hypothetical protein